MEYGISVVRVWTRTQLRIRHTIGSYPKRNLFRRSPTPIGLAVNQIIRKTLTLVWQYTLSLDTNGTTCPVVRYCVTCASTKDSMPLALNLMVILAHESYSSAFLETFENASKIIIGVNSDSAVIMMNLL